ncbi:hypothetical protein JK361_02105 [Streptomyces sp. 5-8]|uniref:DUF7144 domain-containing protein n=1 Tax=Streptomyces musisoli TaxID=2802280 RepID=A0ABS1NTR0_9ACTN|nr:MULTISPECIES: hypothetical protein [Streptomyces]MBL1103408.1 hypothetical protein [Streptomyces musisoli]MBY8839987.1 hypothetical protein [Streptomyces sp. SP2-10]
MSQAAQPTGPTPAGGSGPPRQTAARSSGWVTGGITFAGVLMVCSGILALLQGIAAVAGNDVYFRIGAYIYKMNLTGWGTIHIIIGALVLATGIGLLMDMAWARFAGLFLVALSLIAQFLFLPYAPVWSLILIALDVFIIWALATRQEEAV